jgi:hypothetical protein
MKNFKQFCEQAFHPDLVNKLSDPKVQKNLQSTIIKPGQRFASGPPPIAQNNKKSSSSTDNTKKFLGRIVSNAPY